MTLRENQKENIYIDSCIKKLTDDIQEFCDWGEASGF